MASSRANWVRWLDKFAMPAVFVVLFATLCGTVANFSSKGNLIVLATSVSLVGMVACTMLFCLASGDFDLSVGSIVMASGVTCALIIGKSGSVLLGLTAGIALGGLVGLVNGTVIARLGINALITTLATMQITRGIGFIACRGQAVSIPVVSFFRLGIGKWLGVPTPIWVTLACLVLFGILLHMTTFGRQTLAIGGNKEAARLSGIPVQRVRVLIFTIQGLVAGLAGCVTAARMNMGQPNVGENLALDCISGCVLGGVSLTGGSGSILGVVVGVLIMGTVQNAMDLANIETYYQYVVRGGILLAAVLFDQWRRKASHAQ
ncbi:MAG: L-arabinose ABC transporter permease AraH [Armatimonadetes bacterium]|nr:L-arabinose ABC transporter permease AraH [Armatimonadota bacterium]